MKQITHWLVLAVGIASLALAIVIGSSTRALATNGPSSVVVTNAQVPVSGTITANQGGVWTVGISGQPTVQVARPQPNRVVLVPEEFGASWVNNTGHTFVIEDVSAVSVPDAPGAFLLLQLFDGETLFNYAVLEYSTAVNPPFAHALTHFIVQPGEQLFTDGPVGGHIVLTGSLEP